MEDKCLLETREKSFCSEFQTWHLSKLIGYKQEFEIIVTRLNLPHDLYPERNSSMGYESMRNIEITLGKTGACDAHASTRSILVGGTN